MGSMPGSLLSRFRQEVATSPELTRFAASHAIHSSLRLEDHPAPLSAAPPPSTSGLKAWLDSGMRTLSRRNSHGSSIAGSSDGGYSSGDGGGSSELPSATASGKPVRVASGRRVTIMPPSAAEPAGPAADNGSAQAP